MFKRESDSENDVELDGEGGGESSTNLPSELEEGESSFHPVELFRLHVIWNGPHLESTSHGMLACSPIAVVTKWNLG